MEIQIELTHEIIPAEAAAPPVAAHGAWLEFRGVVRGEENGHAISALEYEAYPEMAVREIRRLLEDISKRHPCLAAKIIHRTGIIPVGQTAIYAGVAGLHRAEAIALLAEFMDKLKQDVPIWKRRTLPLQPIAAIDSVERSLVKENRSNAVVSMSLDRARAEIASRCSPLPGVRAPLRESFGRILRETIAAPADMPDSDRSTRDGYAVLQNDSSKTFRMVDTIHAADWKPRNLKRGETVRVATGASMPCENLRVVMQEDIERTGDDIRIKKSNLETNIRRRGEEVKAGSPLVQAGVVLGAGKLALLASAGCVQPLISPRMRIIHFTTGDEVIPPEQTVRPGEIRDSNSILIRALLQPCGCELFQGHLKEDFETAKAEIQRQREQMEQANVLLISGGASVGDKDFTRALLEYLGFETVFSQIAVRPGKPTVFAVDGNRIAFGLPGNPLAHFVCFHLFVAPALAKLCGGDPMLLQRGRLAAGLNDAANPRETLWPARWELTGGQARLHPLAWSSSGDITCLAEANALMRIPANSGNMQADAELEFLPMTEG